MRSELPPDPSLEEWSDILTKNRVALDECGEAFEGFATLFSKSPNFKNYRAFKKSNDMLSLAFKNYIFSVAELKDIGIENQQRVIAEIFIDNQAIRVNLFNELTDSADFVNIIPDELQFDEADEDEEEESEDEVEPDYEMTIEEFAQEAVNYQRFYADSNFNQLKKHAIGPKASKLLDLGSKAKKPALETAKVVGGGALGAVIAVSVMERRRSN